MGKKTDNAKSIFIMCLLCFLAAVPLTGCARERITVEKQETLDEEAEEAEQAEQAVRAVSTSTVEAHEYMENKIRDLEPEEECTRIECYFPYDEKTDSKEGKWEKIAALPEVERAVVVTEGLGRVLIPLEKVNPDYYEYYIKGGADETLIQKKGWMEFRVHFYACPDIKAIQLGCFHASKQWQEKGDWRKEVWPLYIEEGESLELLYNRDDEEEECSREITIEKVSDEIPWYLDFSWTNSACIITMPEDVYKELMGQDKTGVNLSGLTGNERYYLECKSGQREKVEQKVKELGIKEVSNPGYLKR